MKHSTHFLLACIAVFFLSACGGLKGTRVTEGNPPAGAMASDATPDRNTASLVHVDLSSRLATMRKGHKFNDNAFLITMNRQGKETGVLKARASRPIGLRTADVLEGQPEINNTVIRASASEAARLAKIYRDAEE